MGYRITELNPFLFHKFCFHKYHYTDNRNGSPMNYIAYMQNGTATIVSAHKTLHINPGDLFFIPINLSYESYWYCDENVEFLSFGFTDIGTKDSFSFDLQIIECNESIKKLVRKIPTEELSITCKALGAFFTAMDRILPYLKQKQKHSKKEEILLKAKKYISAHPDCSVQDIAKELYISEPYLYLLFRENIGCTPHGYQLKAKCKRGTELLLTTDKTVEEISGILGFSSSSHFRRTLKAKTGLTPKDIRKNNEF